MFLNRRRDKKLPPGPEYLTIIYDHISVLLRERAKKTVAYCCYIYKIRCCGKTAKRVKKKQRDRKYFKVSSKHLR